MSRDPDAVERIVGRGHETVPRARCVSEMSGASLIAGAVGLSAALWLAILAII